MSLCKNIIIVKNIPYDRFGTHSRGMGMECVATESSRMRCYCTYFLESGDELVAARAGLVLSIPPF